jgi:hypothetical protein
MAPIRQRQSAITCVSGEKGKGKGKGTTAERHRPFVSLNRASTLGSSETWLHRSRAEGSSTGARGSNLAVVGFIGCNAQRRSSSVSVVECLGNAQRANLDVLD